MTRESKIFQRMAKSALQPDSPHFLVLESALRPRATALHWPESMHKVMPEKGRQVNTEGTLEAGKLFIEDALVAP